jgi:CHAT domain
MPNSEKDILDALANINQLSNPSKRAQELVNLIPELTTPNLLSQALKIVAGISNSGACVLVLSKLSPHLSDNQVLEALKIASNINQSKSRATAITNLSPRLTPDSIQEALKIARELISTKSYRACADLLAAILPQVSPALLQDVLKIAYEIDDGEAKENRVHALTELNKTLENFPNSDSDEFYSPYNSRNSASNHRAKRNEEIDREFCNAPRAKAKILMLFYYYLEGEQRSQVFEKLLETIEDIPAQPCKARSLMAIAPYLSENVAKRVAERAFVIVKEIVEDLNKNLQESNDVSLRKQIEELEEQLQTLPISILLNETLSILKCAEGLLFRDGWWEPNMIEGLPPVPIPSPRQISSEELTRTDQLEGDGNIEVNTNITPQALVRYPNLDCPDKQILNQMYGLEVSLLLDKPEGESPEAMIIRDTGTSELPELEIWVTAKGFDLVSGDVKKIKVKRNDLSKVRFTLIPRRLGENNVKAEFFQYDELIGSISRNILVLEEIIEQTVSQPSQTPSIPVKTALTIPPQDLDLLIDLDRDRRTLRFRLNSWKKEINFGFSDCGQVTLEGSPLEKMQSVYKEMTEMAKKIPLTLEDKRQAEERLDAVGNKLWDELTPEIFKQAYWKFKSRVKSILITSEEPWIPWEMLKPYRYDDNGEQENDSFWCQQFAMSRWLSGGGTADELDITSSRAISPTKSNLPSTKEEIAFLNQLSGLRPNIIHLPSFSTKRQVLDSLQNEELSILHFACHGMFDSTSPNDSAIMLSDAPLRPSDIRVAFGTNRKPQRPLIFLNACYGGQAEFGFTGLGGWAERFVKANAGAFVGAMWEVSDRLALLFAKTFYTALLQDNQSIAESFRQAREEVRKDSPYNSTWLAYTLYADPEGRVKA